MCAAFLQNVPVVRHTRGFTPGWYTVPRWGTPNASAPPRGTDSQAPAPALRQRKTGESDPMYFKAGDRPCRLCSHNGFGRVLRAAAGSVRSEHRNVDTLIPLARPRESPTGPNVPCERRTDPAEPPPPTSSRRQPQHSATAKQVRVPPFVSIVGIAPFSIGCHSGGGWF